MEVTEEASGTTTEKKRHVQECQINKMTQRRIAKTLKKSDIPRHEFFRCSTPHDILYPNKKPRHENMHKKSTKIISILNKRAVKVFACPRKVDRKFHGNKNNGYFTESTFVLLSYQIE